MQAILTKRDRRSKLAGPDPARLDHPAGGLYAAGKEAPDLLYVLKTVGSALRMSD